MKLTTLLIISTLQLWHAEASLFDWIWNNSPRESTALIADGVPLIAIPYESATEDEKFLQEAAKLTEIRVSSALESCQHKVIIQIQSCAQMSEEELGKLSVNLLNCQSAVEGRKMFPCTAEMSLKQCTTDMDADTWNAYHLMSNRARAVCYAARNMQFRALTELTVNKLMSTTHSQIKTLSSLKESQERMEERTMDALSSLTKGNEALLQQQEHLKNAQISAHQLVTTNLRQLYDEKALIRSGHAQLASMTEDIKQRLEKANQDIIIQTNELDENHKTVLQDLVDIQSRIQLIWDKIESSTDRIISQNTEAIDRYEKTLEKLVQINETVNFIWDITNRMHSEIDQKLGWITDYIGDTGEQMHRAFRIVLHIIYILLAMVVAAFLHAPFLTRATIMGIVPLNLVTYLKHGSDASLDFLSITALIFLITIMHFVTVGIQYIFGNNRKNTQLANPIQNGHSTTFTKVPNHSSITSISLLRVRILTMALNSWNIIVQYFNLSGEKIMACIQSAFSWCRRDRRASEKMTCSYVHSSKAHRNTGNFSPSFVISEDSDDGDVFNDPYDKFDDIDQLEDAAELRRRIQRNSRQSSTTRSIATSNLVAPRALCGAITRAGKPCRLFVVQGMNYCNRHTQGSSFIND
ncbi:protein brambleberry [Orussus abietinus]|uniref:protein brambleberry n=1 Tax=Orussus abietinus TaxID=222816 RepID=UPI0006256877|nr:protein brambleberry [Orussus abietinus]XP_012271115.1 protein brambleberry [Orussus abietinus]XP_012271116.1 protein brambleberry [Orussus abietinus]XP_012271117.1 protein brambleberry [Orussus abietinus]